MPSSVSSKYFRKDCGPLNPNNKGQAKAIIDAIGSGTARLSDREYADIFMPMQAQKSLVVTAAAAAAATPSEEDLSFSRLAYFNDMAVGAILCKKVNNDNNKSYDIQILTLGVLEPYRRLGLAKSLIASVLDMKNEDAKISRFHVYVPIADSVLKSLYLSHGFKEAGVVKKSVAVKDTLIFKEGSAWTEGVEGGIDVELLSL